MALTKAFPRMIEGVPISVKDFGAVGDGVTDDTDAFNAAIATGRRVFVPAGSYSVANINVVQRMEIEGEKKQNSSSILLVRENNAAAFRHSNSGIVSDIRIANFEIKPASGVTGAKAYLQDNKDTYTSLATFSGIETFRELEVSYEGFFIFTSWEKCRDGYSGSPVSGQTHQFIKSVPAAYGQAKATNLNQVIKCQAFRSDATNGAVDIQYGVSWTFRDTDFEDLSTNAVYARGIFNLRFESCWFESIASAGVVNVGTSPAPNPQGTSPVTFENCHSYLPTTTGAFLNGGGAYEYSVSRCTFSEIPAGLVLGTKDPRDLNASFALSGAGQSGFFDGFKSLTNNTVIRNSQLIDTVIPTPSSQQINVLPIGPSGLGASNFTVDDLGAGTATLSNVSSDIGLSGNAIKLVMVNNFSWFYYEIPSKLTQYLRNRKITLVATGYGDGSASVNEGINLRIWEDVTPSSTNFSAASSNEIDVASTSLQTAFVTHTINSSTNNLYVGMRAGGSNPGDAVIIDLMALLLGEQTPLITQFR